MLNRILEFAEALRTAGLPVSLSEDIDALRAIEHVTAADKERFRAALASTMVKTGGHRVAFDTLFELYFGTGRGPEILVDESGDRDDEDLRARVYESLASADGGSMRGLAQAAVGAFGRVESSRTNDWYSQYQVMRALDLNRMLDRFDESLEGLDPFDRQLARDAFSRRSRSFRALTQAETRRRVAEHRGAAAVARYAVDPLPEDLTFVGLGSDLKALRRTVRPLARKLASRVAVKRKRATRGHVDIRRTVRRSLSTGGVPFDVAIKRRVPRRPELFLLCDVSSSVGRFARFTLMLTHAMSAQFSRVRAFAFVDTIDEVTRFFEEEDFVTAIERMNREADVVGHDGRSDYGTCLEIFSRRYGRDLSPRSTVLILGDARNNYRTRKTHALRAIAERCRHVYWLNPEPLRDWDTGDSAASEYAAEVDKMVEVRNLKQLENFVAEVL